MTFMPGFEQAQDFPGASDHLPRVPFASFAGQAFASLAPAAPFDAFFADIAARLAWLPFDDLRHDPSRDRDFEIAGHWALYVENYLEGLHIPFLHPGLNQVLDMDRYEYHLGRYGSLQLAQARDGDAAFELPPSSPDHGRRIAAYYWWVFPNLMLNFYPWGLSLNLVQPLAPDRTRVSFRGYVLDAGRLGERRRRRARPGGDGGRGGRRGGAARPALAPLSQRPLFAVARARRAPLPSAAVRVPRASPLTPLRIALAGLVALAVAMGIGRFAFTPIMPMMLHDGGVDLQHASWLASTNYLGYLVGALLCTFDPWLRRRLGLRKPADGPAIVRHGLVATALLTLAMALPWPATWPTLRFAAGVVSAYVLLHSSGWCLAQLAARGTPSLGGVMFAGPGVGIVGSGLLGGAMVAWQWRASAAWIVFGLLAALLTRGGVAGVPARERSAAAARRRPHRRQRRRRRRRRPLRRPRRTARPRSACSPSPTASPASATSSPPPSCR